MQLARKAVDMLINITNGLSQTLGFTNSGQRCQQFASASNSILALVDSGLVQVHPTLCIPCIAICRQADMSLAAEEGALMPDYCQASICILP